ncbi:hypothetical protein BGZ60DRAFT_427987 [Tricladium varicosporioides]|nr:hypothetical protein BGZ60DRAFT_427987 [Hymenoscyphus varicosporioides]
MRGLMKYLRGYYHVHKNRNEPSWFVKPHGTPPTEPSQPVHQCLLGETESDNSTEALQHEDLKESLEKPRDPAPVKAPLQVSYGSPPEEVGDDDGSAKALRTPSHLCLKEEIECEWTLNLDEFYWTQLCQLPNTTTNSSAPSSSDNSSIFSDCSYSSNLSEYIVEDNVGSDVDNTTEGIPGREGLLCRTLPKEEFLLGMGFNELYVGMSNDDWFLAEPSFAKLFEDLDLEETKESGEADLGRDSLSVKAPKTYTPNEVDTKILNCEANFKVYTQPTQSLPVPPTMEFASHMENKTTRKTSVRPTPIATPWNLNYQDNEERSSLMDLLENMPVEIQDSSGKKHVQLATLDTGSGTSFVNGQFCSRHGLWRRPISPEGLKMFSTVGGSFVPTHHVSVPLRISSIGLDSFSTVMLLIANLPPNTNIILGRDFLGKHKILQFSSSIKARLSVWKERNCPSSPSPRSSRNVLVIEAKDSMVPTQENTVHNISSGLAIARQFQLAPQSDTYPAESQTACTGDDFSDLNSESSMSVGSSEGSYSDLDPHDIATEGVDMALYPYCFSTSNDEKILNAPLVPMIQRIVKGLVKEYQDICLQDWVDNTRQCSPQSDSATPSQNQTTNFCKLDSPTSVASKRARASDEENPDGDNGGPPKRQKGKPPGPSLAEIINHKFACPYRKHNAQKYCATSRQWKFCATSSFENVSRLKAHLYKYHKIHQCTRCWQNFPTAETLKTHVNATEECQRCVSREAEGASGVNAEMERRLRSRKKTEDAWSQKDRWIKIFTMLFGSIDVPDPYFEQPIIEEIDPTYAALSPDSRQLSDIETFLRAELPRVVEIVLQQVAQYGVELIENQLRLLLPDVIRDSQDQVFSHYRSRLASGQESPLPHAQLAAPIVEAIMAQPNVSLQLSHEQPVAFQSLSWCEQPTNLERFYSQPPFLMLPSGPDYTGVLATGVNTLTSFEQISMVDSGFQADSIDTTQNLGEVIELANITDISESGLTKPKTPRDLNIRDQTPNCSKIPAPESTPPLLAALLEPSNSTPVAEISPTSDQINEMLEDPETKALFEEFYK